MFLSLWAVFTLLTFLITHGGLDEGPEHDLRVLQTTLGTLTGPLTGAIARGFQRCCLKFSLSLMVFCAPILSAGILAQFMGPLGGKKTRIVRMSLWILGWLAWFLGGIVSFGHALA